MIYSCARLRERISSLCICYLCRLYNYTPHPYPICKLQATDGIILFIVNKVGFMRALSHNKLFIEGIQYQIFI